MKPGSGEGMKKSELLTAVASRLPCLTRKDAEIIVEIMFDSMVQALTQGDRIDIRGLGSFAVKHRPAREGRNPRTGETVHIPAKRLPHFEVGKVLYGRINPTVAE